MVEVARWNLGPNAVDCRLKRPCGCGARQRGWGGVRTSSVYSCHWVLRVRHVVFFPHCSKVVLLYMSHA